MENQYNFNIDERFMSDSIDQLATALAKAQAEFIIASKDKKNPFYKSNYADFESVVNASRPALTKHGLSVLQPPLILSDGNSYLVTIVMHASGQWIKSTAKHNPLKTDIQSLSSYNTYLKRMCYSSLLGVVTGEMDDDGNSGSTQPRINQNQLNILAALPKDRQDKICAFSNVNHLDELTVEQYDKVITMLKNSGQK